MSTFAVSFHEARMALRLGQPSACTCTSQQRRRNDLHLHDIHDKDDDRPRAVDSTLSDLSYSNVIPLMETEIDNVPAELTNIAAPDAPPSPRSVYDSNITIITEPLDEAATDRFADCHTHSALPYRDQHGGDGVNLSNKAKSRCVRCAHMEALRQTLMEEVKRLESQLSRRNGY
eukprot:GILJ01002941.1.p2 GENE.GILJ01002941.1~~GILJ01002941.1.p2  ORF type:complete len:174 (+),score=11.17 GILJ01002941.1:103-624(+)